MTLLFIDGFDHYATADVLTKWTAFDTSSAGQSIATSSGRRGGNGWTSTTTGRGLTRAIPNSTTVVLGFALNLGGAAAGAINLIEFRESGTIHVALLANSDNSVSVLRGATTLATSSAGVLPSSGYCYLELKATINDSTGAYEVRVNGANVLSGTGADTRNGGTGVITNVAVRWVRSNAVIDDLYICDGSGSTNNDFLGDQRVDCYFPNGNGNSSQLLGSDGNSTDNYLLVDDSSPNGDTDYVQSATSGQKDTYAISNMMHTPATIAGVQVCMSSKKDDAGTRSICSVVRSGGSDTDGTTQALSTTYNYYLQIIEQDPNTSTAWTVSGFNAAEFGQKVAA